MDKILNLKSAVIAYIIVAILTFGHSFNHIGKDRCNEEVLIGALTCAIAWPLYWSARLFEPSDRGAK